MKKNDLLGKYKLIRRLGAGSFGDVWEVTYDNNNYAMKMEQKTAPQKMLRQEYLTLKDIGDGIDPNQSGIPRVYDIPENEKYYSYVMDLLGDTLESCKNNGQGCAPEKEVLKYAREMILSLQFIHKKGYIHRDIKPENFAFGRTDGKLYIIDFGLATKYKKNDPKIKHASLTGTARYASINALRYYEQSPRDDMESLAYVWAYLLRKERLPWQGLKVKRNQNLHEEILKIKEKTTPEELFKGFPPFFKNYLEEVKKLGFSEEIKYKTYIDQINEILNDGKVQKQEKTTAAGSLKIISPNILSFFEIATPNIIISLRKPKARQEKNADNYSQISYQSNKTYRSVSLTEAEQTNKGDNENEENAKINQGREMAVVYDQTDILEDNKVYGKYYPYYTNVNKKTDFMLNPPCSKHQARFIIKDKDIRKLVHDAYPSLSTSNNGIDVFEFPIAPPSLFRGIAKELDE